MILSSRPPLHLTYCLNIHPGETWAENLAAIENYAVRVRQAVAPGQRFGLGLRLSNEAARELSDPERLQAFRRFLKARDLYVFTINGFPYGRFHGTAVKENVYRPDWRTVERRDYTIRLIDILAALLPEGVSGSVSTVPGAYKPWIRTPEDVQRMCRLLAEVALHAAAVRESAGKDVCLALEPEPDCFLETTDEAIAFLAETLPGAAPALGPRLGVDPQRLVGLLARHVGVCFDTAHAAVQFEDPAESLRRIASAGVRVGKVQLSSALRLQNTAAALRRLGGFAEDVYLHQTRLRHPDGSIEGFPDLPEAIASAGRAAGPEAELRVHFHVPLFFVEAGPLASTSSLLAARFWELLLCSREPHEPPAEHLEIETYTFGVLPDELRAADVTESIRKEFEWVLAHVARAKG